MIMKPIIVIQYKKLEFLPPVMALLQTLKALGKKVVYVGVHSDTGEDFLEVNGIEGHFMPNFNHRYYSSRNILDKVTNRIGRGFAFFSHRHWMQRTLLSLEKKYGEPIIWHSEVASAALLGDWGLRYHNRLLTIYELADFRGSTWLGFSLKKCLQNVHLVVPEFNRACILKEFFHLSESPSVIPNKPFYHPRTRDMALPENGPYNDVFAKIAGRPIFLYQGIWNEDRVGVAKVLEVIARNRSNYCIVSMPDCKAVQELSRKYSNVFGLPYVSPPNHLAVTSHATVGIAIYNAAGRGLLQRLGAIYCAPNKIYEYAGFGIPTLGNDLPGLKYTVEMAGAGICCSMTEESILSAADRLVAQLDSFRQKANEFYMSVDLEQSVQKILLSVEG